MKQETYEQAKRLEQRIQHISEVIEKLGKYDYKLQPHTRQSNYSIWRGSESEICLNEGEVVFIRKALEDEKSRLIQEFAML